MACRRNIYKYQEQMKEYTIISFDGSVTIAEMLSFGLLRLLILEIRR